MICLACPRVWKETRSTHSPFKVPQKDSVTALAEQLPVRLMLIERATTV